MKVWLAGLVLVALTGVVQAREPGVRDLGFFGVAAREIMLPECVVRFHTGGVGGPQARDAAQWRAIETFLTMSPLVKSASRYGWGKEGEKTYCVVPTYAAHACETAQELEKVLAGSTLAVEVDMLPMVQVCDQHGRRIEAPKGEEQEAEPEGGHEVKKGGH